MYLRDHLNFSGGSNLVLKYTGRSLPALSTSSRPSTPTLAGLGLRQRTLGARSPLTSPSRFIQNRESVEALFQGAAKGVIERGEKLGINQAVRDAMGEIRRNMQNFQETRNTSRPGRDLFGEVTSPSTRTVVEMDRRNLRLAAMLEETITSLKAVAGTKPDNVKDKAAEAMELAAAKIQFVKVYLEDPSLSLPVEEAPPSVNALSFTSNKENATPTVAIDKTVVTMTTATPAEAAAAPLSPPPIASLMKADSGTTPDPRPSSRTPVILESPKPDAGGDHMDMDSPKPSPVPSPNPNDNTARGGKEQRPKAPIPTRSTLAQSSFSWMLEPDVSPSSSSSAAATPRNRAFSSKPGAAAGHRKRPSNSNASRERNAFLFGEVTSDSSDEHTLTSDEIFGLEPLRKALPKSKTTSP